MSNIIITVETGADMPEVFAERYGICKVPMRVTFGNVTKDNGAFPVSEIRDWYKKTGQVPKTSGCSPDAFQNVFDALHEKWQDRPPLR